MTELPEDMPLVDTRRYLDVFSEILLQDLGPVVSKAVYDPSMLPAVVSSFKDDETSVFGAVAEDFSLFNHDRPPVPKSQATTPHRLLLLKLTTSIGIGRIHRDAALHAMYDAAKTQAERRLVVRHVRRAVRAMVNHFFIGLQMIIDVIIEGHAFKRVLHERQHWHDFDVDTDPLLLMMSTIKHTHKPSDLEPLQERIERRDFLKELVPAQRTSDRAFVRVHVLEYQRGHINRASPGTGKYWNYFRPTSGCSSLTRTCEEPEACRLVCNIDYLMSAGSQKTYHRFVGFGSNNDFGWEESTARLFADRSAGTTSVAPFHGIRSMTTLDCTVQHWNIPGYMARHNNFMTGRICIDQAAGHGDRIRIDALKQLVLDGESRAAGTKLEVKGKRVDVPPRTADQAALFDDVAIFKVDVEGHEHSAISGWAKLELRDLKKTKGQALQSELDARTSGSSADAPLTLIDFERDVPSFFTVSMFQLELHERVGGKSRWRFDSALLQGFRMQQYLASLGFIQISQERNAFGDCCYELVYAHYRYLVRSELRA